MVNLSSISLKQPRALVPLFFVELWERFGYYAVQAVLILYLTQIFHVSDNSAYDLYGIVSAFTFATPLLGGYVADKILGYRYSVLLGAVLLMLGYWLLMIPGVSMFYWALAFIVIGTGFFKSCISTLLGLLYESQDPRRDGGFTIFYMGINLGSFFGPLMSGFVSVHMGWPFVFGFTGAGLIVSFVIAIFTFRLLGDKGLPPPLKTLDVLGVKISLRALLLFGTLIVVALFGWLIAHHDLANLLFRFVCVACVLGILLLAFRSQGIERNNMYALLVFLIFSIGFWAIYSQMYTSVNLFTDRLVERHIGNFLVPTVWFQSLEGFFIVVLTPFFVYFWNYVDRSNIWLKSGAAKFTLAFLGLTLAFLIWGDSIIFTAHGHKVNMLWVVLGYLLFTVGEMCLSPIGLSLFSELAPDHYRGMMMGAWMFSISAGYALGGVLAKFSSVPDVILKKTGILHLGHYYHHAFIRFMWLALLFGIILSLLIPFINKLLEHRYD